MFLTNGVSGRNKYLRNSKQIKYSPILQVRIRKFLMIQKNRKIKNVRNQKIIWNKSENMFLFKIIRMLHSIESRPIGRMSLVKT